MGRPAALNKTISEVGGRLFRASPEGRTGVSSYTGEEGRHLGGIIGIPWPGSEAGLGVHVAIIRSFFVVCAAIVAAVGTAAGCIGLFSFYVFTSWCCLYRAARGTKNYRGFS